MFEKLIKPMSPVSQDFIWVADYMDGTHLSEFDFATHKEHSFYEIQKDKLLRFGLVGQGKRYYFDADGIFYLSGIAVEVAYSEDGKQYPLTGYIGRYNDIIQYKDVDASLNLISGGFRSQVSQYNFGYKTVIPFDDVKFNFRAICHVSRDNPMHITFRLVSDRDINGKLLIKRNNSIVQEFDAPLKKGVGGELNWVVT